MNYVIHLLYSTVLVSSGLHYALGFNSASRNEQNDVHEFASAAVPNLPAPFSEMFGECGKKHSLRVTAFKKNKRSSRRIFENAMKLLTVLKEPRSSFVKRDAQALNHVVKCLQRNNNTVTCFSRGKFYQFEGDLQTIFGEHSIKNKRFCSNCGSSRKHHILERAHHSSNGSLLTKKLSNNNRVVPPRMHFTPYQEVMMEPRSRTGGLHRCYGFVAPQRAGIHQKKGHNLTNPKPKNLISVETGGNTIKGISRGNSDNLVTSLLGRVGTDRTVVKGSLNSKKIVPSNYDPKQNSGSGNQRWSLQHVIAKRSQIVSVACRPLYIPTLKPSVNEGKVPQCRIPCGAHNCGPIPTCPCRPPSRTPAPPPTTCPPIPGLAESEATLTLPTRCPAYEFTDEPCPTFECKDGCPYLTTPGCPSTSFGANKGAAREGQPSNEVGKVLPAYTSAVAKVPPEPSAVALEDRGSAKPSNTVHQISRASMDLTATQTTRSLAEDKSPKGNSSLLQGTGYNSNVTGKHRMESLSENNGLHHIIESTFGPKVPAVWSNFDFMKLLKSAKTHYNGKVESNLRNYRNEA